MTLLFALLDCMPRLRALAYPLLLLAIGGSALSLRGQFSAVGAALTLMVHGQPLALAAYSQELSLLLSARLYGHWRVALPKRAGVFPVGAARNRAAVHRLVSRRADRAPRRCCR